MKTIFTFILIVLTSATGIAQITENNDKVDAIEMGIVMVVSIDNTEFKKEITSTTKNEVVRLYRYKNSRVKKELTFSTKKNRSKMA